MSSLWDSLSLAKQVRKASTRSAASSSGESSSERWVSRAAAHPSAPLAPGALPGSTHFRRGPGRPNHARHAGPDEAIESPRIDSFTIDDKYKALVLWYVDEEVFPVYEINIMSHGSKVLPRHYVPFLEAVEVLSGKQKWSTDPP